MDRQRQKKRSSARGERGFTLVEVLVSALLFAIGMIALVAMQFSALGGYASARDVSQATQVGQRVIQITRIEAQQWREGVNRSSISFPYTSSKSKNAMQSVSGPVMNMANGWSWTRVFPEPVDERLTTTGAQRFCVYVRGNEFQGNTGSGAMNQRIQVAVVYGGAGTTVIDSNGECPANGDTINGVTLTDRLSIDSNGIVNAEKDGFRVVMVGGVIRQRIHLGS